MFMETFLLFFGSVLNLFTFILFLIHRRFYYYSIILFYPLIGQLLKIEATIGSLVINPSVIFGLSIMMLTLFDVIQKRTEDFIIEGLVLFFIIYSMIISYLFSPVPVESLAWTLKMFLWLLLILGAQKTITSKKDYKILSRIILVAAFIVIISFFLSMFGFYGQSLTYETGVRSYGAGFSSGKSIAYHLAFVIVALFYKIHDKEIMTRLFWFSFSFLSLMVILLSFVRAPVVGLFVAFIVYQFLSVFFLKKNLVKVFFITFCVTCIIGSVYILGSKTMLFGRWTEISHKLNEGRIEKLGSGRIGGLLSFYSYYTIDTSLAQKLFGTGIGSSVHYLRTGKVIHNDYAEILMGTGFIGLGIYLLILVRILKKLFDILNNAQTKPLKELACLSISGFFLFLALNMTNVTSGVFYLSLWAINTGAVLGVGAHNDVDSLEL